MLKWLDVPRGSRLLGAMTEDEILMHAALDEARKAADAGEVPIGALIFDPSSKNHRGGCRKCADFTP